MNSEILTVRKEDGEWRVLTDKNDCLYHSRRKRDATLNARKLAFNGGWSQINIWTVSGDYFESVMMKP